MPKRRLRWGATLLGVVLAAGGAATPSRGPAVEAWITTGDQRRLLARDAVPALCERAALQPRIDVDTPRRFQSMVGSGRGRPTIGASDFLRRHHSLNDRPPGETDLALTLHNEPHNEPHFEPHDCPGMRLDSGARAKLVGRHRGPLLERPGMQPQLIESDHNRDQPQAPLVVLA